MDAVATKPTNHQDDTVLSAQTLYGRSISTRLSSVLPLPHPEEGVFLAEGAMHVIEPDQIVYVLEEGLLGSRWSAFHSVGHVVLKGPIVYAAQPVPAHVDEERVRTATRLHRLPAPVLGVVAMVALLGFLCVMLGPLLAAVWSSSVSQGDAYSVLIPVVLVGVMGLVSLWIAVRRVVDALAANPYKKRSFAISTPSAAEGSVQDGKVSLASLLTRQRLVSAAGIHARRAIGCARPVATQQPNTVLTLGEQARVPAGSVVSFLAPRKGPLGGSKWEGVYCVEEAVVHGPMEVHVTPGPCPGFVDAVSDQMRSDHVMPMLVFFGFVSVSNLRSDIAGLMTVGVLGMSILLGLSLMAMWNLIPGRIRLRP